jgi:hypothetical protein
MVKAFVLAYCALLCQAIPTESMARPGHLKDSSTKKRGLEERARTNGKVQIGYFTNCTCPIKRLGYLPDSGPGGIYDRNFRMHGVLSEILPADLLQNLAM